MYPIKPQSLPARPVLPPSPHAPLRARAARLLLRRLARHVPMRVHLGPGPAAFTGGPPLLHVERPEEFFARLGAHGKIGFGEAYMSGAWHSPDLPALLTALASRIDTLVPPPLQRLRRLYELPRPPAHDQSPARAARNICHHYDLSNEFFALFLDPTMTYSAGMTAPGLSLEEAQLRKIDVALDAAGVRSGTRLLEIGTGWGALACRAAERGAHVTAITLSPRQRAWAEKAVERRGLSGRVSVQLRDYRAVEGRYDAVISIEMIEAVGARYWPAYFRAVEKHLVPSGTAVLQAITMPHARMESARHTDSWIEKYIFPGGLIPSLQAIEQCLQAHTSLRITTRRAFGADYAWTLAAWRGRFLTHLPQTRDLGFGEEFIRMWDFYLAYCQAGFQARYLDVGQYTLRRAG